MKNLILIGLVFIESLAFGIGGTVDVPSDLGTLVELNLAASNLTTSYGGTTATFTTGLTGKKNFCILNGNSTAILGRNSDSACSAGQASHFVIPGGGATCLERVRVRSKICLKSQTGTLTSGWVYGINW